MSLSGTRKAKRKPPVERELTEYEKLKRMEPGERLQRIRMPVIGFQVRRFSWERK